MPGRAPSAETAHVPHSAGDVINSAGKVKASPAPGPAARYEGAHDELTRREVAAAKRFDGACGKNRFGVENRARMSLDR
jgi:hypothetical protein